MVASAPPQRTTTGIAYARCTFHHHVMRRDFESWHDIPSDKRQVYSCKGGLPDVFPVCTNGVLFLSLSPTGPFIGHVSNLISPDTNTFKPRVRVTKPSVRIAKEKKQKFNFDPATLL